MTNPDNAVGTNAAYSGRTSVDAFNDGLSLYNRGILTGWACEPSSGLVVTLGGDGSTRDVAIAEDNIGNKTTINNISEAPIEVTIDSAPTTYSRIDSIVAYVDNPPAGSETITDNYEACGLIVVNGDEASSPSAASESTIRSAITTDGASGSSAYYVVLATVTMAVGTTDITSDMITAGDSAAISSDNIADGAITSAKIADEAVTSDNIADGAVTSDKIDFTLFNGNYSTSEKSTNSTWIDGSTIYKKTIYISALPNATTGQYSHGISNMETVISISGTMITGTGAAWPLPQANNPLADSLLTAIRVYVTASKIVIDTGTDRSDLSAYVTLLYTKSS